MTLLAKRYATALYRLAEASGAVDALGADVLALHGDLVSAGARSLLVSPDVTAAERARILAKLAAGRHPLLGNLLGVLEHRRRLDVLFDLHDAWQQLVFAARGEVAGVAEAPHALAEPDMAALTALASRLSGKKVTLTQEVRPGLLGGVRLRIGNVLYDGSMQAALEQLEQKLLQASI